MRSIAEEDNPLHIRYFRWLYDQVVQTYDVEGLSSYGLVCDRMHNTIFQALVEHDSNRIAEGAELRNEFLKFSGGEILDKVDVLYPDATVFEVLVGLAKHANTMVEMDLYKWFDLFLRNLKLDVYSDWYCMNHRTWKIDKIIDVFNNRRYDEKGKGGLFPLKIPGEDQRRVELWYQMAAFTTENMMY
jgi:hypothetical protein